MNHLRGPLAAGAVPMALGVQLRGDRGNGGPTALRRFATQLTHAVDQGLFGREVSIRLHAFDAFAAGALPFTGGPQFQDDHALFEFATAPSTWRISRQVGSSPSFVGRRHRR